MEEGEGNLCNRLRWETLVQPGETLEIEVLYEKSEKKKLNRNRRNNSDDNDDDNDDQCYGEE